MSTEQLNKISDFFELQQSHYQVSAGVGTNVDLATVDLAAKEAAAQKEIDERGEGWSPFSSDIATVLGELDDRVDTAAEDGLDESEIGDLTPEEAVDEVMQATTELVNLTKYAVFWSSGQDEESRFTFEIYTQDGCSLDLVLGYD